MTVNTVGIEVPSDFPAKAYNEFHDRIAPLQPKHPEAYKHYAGGWNAVAYRFVSATEYDAEFAKSIVTTSSPTERHIQERSLFGFFISAVAVLDSAAYGIHAVAHMINLKIALTDPHLVKFSSVTDEFRENFGSERIAFVLEQMSDDRELKQMRDIRNVLGHRESTLRDYNSSSPTPTWDLKRHLLSSGLAKLEIDQTITSQMRNVLSANITLLADAACDFATAHF